MKRRGFAWWELLAVIALVIIAALILLPVFARSEHTPNRRGMCQVNLKLIGLGFIQYTQDFDNHYPLVAFAETTGGVRDASGRGWSIPAYGWADAIQPYVKSTQVYQCPSETDAHSSTEPNQRGYIDYWYNRNLAGKNEKKISSSSSLIIIGDGADGSDDTSARYNIGSLPAAWRTDKTSPAYRHLDSANYTFADGHVKWYKPAQVSDTSKSGQPTLRAF